MTTKKLKMILIPCLSAGVAIATITPAIVLSNGAKIKIRYEDYGTACTISENFDLPFYLEDQLKDNEDIKMDFNITYRDQCFSYLRFDPDHPFDIQGNRITYHMHVNIDWQKVKEDTESFLALSCKFTCFQKGTDKTFWTDTINKIYLMARK